MAPNHLNLSDCGGRNRHTNQIYLHKCTRTHTQTCIYKMINEGLGSERDKVNASDWTFATKLELSVNCPIAMCEHLSPHIFFVTFTLGPSNIPITLVPIHTLYPQHITFKKCSIHNLNGNFRFSFLRFKLF